MRFLTNSGIPELPFGIALTNHPSLIMSPQQQKRSLATANIAEDWQGSCQASSCAWRPLRQVYVVARSLAPTGSFRPFVKASTQAFATLSDAPAFISLQTSVAGPLCINKCSSLSMVCQRAFNASPGDDSNLCIPVSNLSQV